jgi:tetratricopeptide (TPR) repeat protein
MLMNQGQYAQAAVLFERIAQRAENKAPARAPHLYIQAGKAWFLNENYSEAISKSKIGITLLSRAKRYGEIQQIGFRINNLLLSQGLTNEAEEINRFIGQVLDQAADEHQNISLSIQPSAAILPNNCDKCGAPILPADLVWADELTAICEYCGNRVRGEKA